VYREPAETVARARSEHTYHQRLKQALSSLSWSPRDRVGGRACRIPRAWWFEHYEWLLILSVLLLLLTKTR
jgi:hypothetical protein